MLDVRTAAEWAAAHDRPVPGAGGAPPPPGAAAPAPPPPGWLAADWWRARASG
jgi:hypothetical protein